MHSSSRSPLYVRLVSPTGVRLRARLTRVGPGLWRAAWHFTDDGQWTLSVPRVRAVARVQVFQPFAALPPFKPNRAGASALSGIASPGLVLGR